MMRIDIYGTGTEGNIVAGNFIGTDVTGTRSLGIAGDGVFLAEGASSNRIGGTTASARDVISGNGWDGVDFGDSGTTCNVVEGDYIGTDVSGSKSLGNAASGVAILAGATNNLVGGTATGARKRNLGKLGVWRIHLRLGDHRKYSGGRPRSALTPQEPSPLATRDGVIMLDGQATPSAGRRSKTETSSRATPGTA